MKTAEPVSRALLSVTFLVFAGSGLAGDIRYFDIYSAVAYALSNNPSLNASQQQVVAATENIDASDGGSFPVLGISHTARVSDDPLDAFADKLLTRQITNSDFDPALLNDPASSDLYLTQLTLRWPVYTGGKVSALQQQARLKYDQSKQLYRWQRQQTAFDTMKAFLHVVAANKAVLISEQAVMSAKQHAMTTADLAKQERIVESDKLSAEVNLAAVKAQHEQTITRRKHAYTQLKMVMGFMDRSIQIQSEWPESAPFASGEVDKMADRALRQRDDLSAARSAIEAAQAQVDVASSVRKPNVDLIAKSNWYDDQPGFDSQSSSLIAVASFNLYDGQQDGNIGSSRAKHQEMKWYAQALEQKVRSQVSDTLDDLSEAKKRYTLAEDNVALAEKAVKLVKQRYGQGRTILLDLLQSEKVYTDARIEKLTAELNIRVNRLALSLAVGELPVTAASIQE